MPKPIKREIKKAMDKYRTLRALEPEWVRDRRLGEKILEARIGATLRAHMGEEAGRKWLDEEVERMLTGSPRRQLEQKRETQPKKPGKPDEPTEKARGRPRTRRETAVLPELVMKKFGELEYAVGKKTVVFKFGGIRSEMPIFGKLHGKGLVRHPTQISHVLVVEGGVVRELKPGEF